MGIELPWLFDVPPDHMVVTTEAVTREGKPVRYVTHEEDPEEGVIWQFHSGPGEYSSSTLQLVRLDEILELDASLVELSEMPIGFSATRPSAEGPWLIQRDSGVPA